MRKNFLYINSTNTLSFDGVEYYFNNLPKDVVFNGDVCARNKRLTNLPDFSTWMVIGEFDCSFNQLTDLNGCPKEIKGDFYCDYTNIHSLEYGPEKVSGVYSCDTNQLSSLKYCPREVYDMSCTLNNITSLEYCPDIIHGDFDCSTNLLTSLEHCPETIGGRFQCSSNHIKTIDRWPSSTNSCADLYNNPIEYIKDDLLSIDTLVTMYKICDMKPAKELLMKIFGVDDDCGLCAMLAIMDKS